MAYPTVPGRKFSYDVGGGSVYYAYSATGLLTPLTTEQMSKLNGTTNTTPVISRDVYNVEGTIVVYVFLPHRFIVSGLASMHKVVPTQSGYSITVSGSTNSTNGLDGTWLSATLPNGNIPAAMLDDDSWRDSIQPCSFSEAVRVIRVKYTSNYDANSYHRAFLYALHIYGMNATGEVANDLLFLDDDATGDPEFIRDLDFGDRPEGTTTTHRIKIYNSSTTKTANGITLSLIDQNYTFSMDEGATWVTGATISTLAPSTASSSILIKDTVPPPMQLLGPRSPRIEARVGSWT